MGAIFFNDFPCCHFPSRYLLLECLFDGFLLVGHDRILLYGIESGWLGMFYLGLFLALLAVLFQKVPDGLFKEFVRGTLLVDSKDLELFE